MLTSDLLRVKVIKDEIQPRYIDATKKRFLNHAERLIEVYKENVGQNRGVLDEDIKDVIGDGTDFVIQKGLSKLLSDRCEFEVVSRVPPRDLRERIFALSAQHHPVALQPDHHHTMDRNQLLTLVGEEFELSADEVEAAMYADLQDAYMLQSFDPIKAIDLLHRYNLALAQALLFRATHLYIELRNATAQRLRQMMRYIKFFRLIATAQPLGHNHYKIHIDGPLSLFRFTQKYGVQMATFLPALLLCDDWHLEAEIKWEDKKPPYRFFLDNDTELTSHYPDRGVYLTQEEQRFRKKWKTFTSEWSLEPHTQILRLGTHDTLVSDYILKHEDGREILLVVMGFWQRNTLLRKLELIQDFGPENLLIAAPARLRASQEDLPDEVADRVYFFKEVIHPKKIAALADLLNP
ncbi:MAG: DUF790 family protein [Deltaproteobacteria bacterium]|nr:MAG: DUF790 family protein [Deltaproteobacteria bacterium]